MIPKDAYVLICYKDFHEPKILFPMKQKGIKDESKFDIIEHSLIGEHEYIFDYKEVEEYIKNKLGLQFSKITVCKAIDMLNLEIKSVYKQ